MSTRRWRRTLPVAALVSALVLGACSTPAAVPSQERSSVPPDPSGQQMPVGDLPGWKQTFADDFTSGDVLRGSWPGPYAKKWDAYPEPWRDTSGHGVYSPRRVLSVKDGVLDMYLHTKNGQPYVAAPEPDLNGKGARGQTYGRYTVRFRADQVPGYKTAWLLWPDSGKRKEGEIDFPEADLDSTINGFVHHVDRARTQDQFPTHKTFVAWHTATTEWTPGKIMFFLDGRLVGKSSTNIPSSRMHWVLQTETALDGPAPSPKSAGHVQVDWVAAYQRTTG